MKLAFGLGGMGLAQANSPGDGALLAAVRRGDAGAWEEFLRRWSPVLYSVVGRFVVEGDARVAFLEIVRRLHAGNGALLADWKPSSSLSAFLSLKAADQLADRITAALRLADGAGWVAFESVYGGEISRIVRDRARHAGLTAEDAQDLEQDVRLRLMEDQGAVLRRFSGRGSFTGFVRIVSRNLAEDLLRARLGRRREPEAVQKLDPLARRVHHLLHVDGHHADQLEHLVRDGSGRLVPKTEIEAALARLDATMHGREPARRPQLVPLTIVSSDGEERERLLPDSTADAETLLIEAQDRERQDAALEALSTALLRLPEEARTYLRHRFMVEPPLPPRRIAQLMGLPVEDLYRRRARWEAALRAELGKLGVGNLAMPSV